MSLPMRNGPKRQFLNESPQLTFLPGLFKEIQV